MQWDVTTRTATTEDIPAISAVASKTFAATFGHSFTQEELSHQLVTTRSPEYFRVALRTDTILVATAATVCPNAKPKGSALDIAATEDRDVDLGADAPATSVPGSSVLGYIQLSDVRLTINGGGPGGLPVIQPGTEDQAVHALYVDPGFQGRGIGSRLLEAAFKHPRLASAPRVFLDVWEENRRAVRFYEKHGFQQVGTCDVVVKGTKVGQDLVMMRSLRLRKLDQ